ncbi:hypothetical protein QTN25_006729 [Entamoeba marina]
MNSKGVVNSLVNCIAGLTIVVAFGLPLLLFMPTIHNSTQYLEEYSTIAPETFSGFRFAYRTGNWYIWYCFITVVALTLISIFSIIPGVPLLGFCVITPIQLFVFAFQIMVVVLLVFGLSENYYVNSTTINDDELTDIEHYYECCIPESEFYTIGSSRTCSNSFTMNCNKEVFENARESVKTIGLYVFLTLPLLSLLNLHILVSLRNFGSTPNFFNDLKLRLANNKLIVLLIRNFVIQENKSDLIHVLSN